MDVYKIIEVMQELKLAESVDSDNVSSIITLNQLYKDQIPQQDDEIYNYGTLIWNKTFNIHTISPYKLNAFLCNQYNVKTVEELFDIMTNKQKRIVDRYINDDDLSNEILVLDDDYIVDGNHRALAAVLTNKPIKYIDLSSTVYETASTGLGGGSAGNNGGSMVGGPETYEQENNRFKSHGARRIMSMTCEQEEILNEAASSKLYHATTNYITIDILKQHLFKLRPIKSHSTEETVAEYYKIDVDKYPYWISCTPEPATSTYVFNELGNEYMLQTMFELNGNYLNSNVNLFDTRAIHYRGTARRYKEETGTVPKEWDENEERVYSSTQTIPLKSLVTALHACYDEKYNNSYIELCKQNNIKLYIYKNPNDCLHRNISNSIV